MQSLAREVLEKRAAETQAEADAVVDAMRVGCGGMDERIRSAIIDAVHRIPGLYVGNGYVQINIERFTDGRFLTPAHTTRYTIGLQVFQTEPPVIG